MSFRPLPVNITPVLSNSLRPFPNRSPHPT